MSDYTGIPNLEVMREAHNYNRFLLDLIASHEQPGDRLVDFGAGTGTFALPLIVAGKTVACVEPDASLAGYLAEKGLNVCHDLAQLPDSSIDYLYSLNVLEHIQDDAAAIALWHRKIRPGGRLLVYVPAFNLLFSSMDRRVGHCRRYRLPELRDKLRAAGFNIRDGRYVDSLGFFATLLFKLIDNGSGDINVEMLRLYDRFVFPISRTLDAVAGKLGGKNLYLAAVKHDRQVACA